MRQLVGQHLYIGISGHSLTQDEKKFIVDNNIGGIVLFGRNVANPKQIHDLCTEIQSLRHKMKDKSPIVIAIDMEGGRVARLKAPFTQWPPLKKLGDLDSPTMSFNFAYSMGMELKAVGINLDFAPCVDVFTNPKNIIIGDRAVSTDPEMVAKHTSALIRGYMKAEVITCAKHFPGHGHTLIDSHEDLPKEEADIKRLHEVELVPFKKSIKSRVDMIMTGHILFENVDPKNPVTISEYFIKDLLKNELKYKGMVITDDLDMKALAKYYTPAETPVLSLIAGADLLLYCNEPESPPTAIESILKAIETGRISKSQIENGYKNLLEFKRQRIKNPDPMDYSDALKIVGNKNHLNLSQAISRGELVKDLVDMEIS